MDVSDQTPDALNCLIRSMSQECQSTILSGLHEILAKWTSLTDFDFQVVFEFSPLLVDNFHFRQAIRDPFIPNMLPSPLSV